MNPLQALLDVFESLEWCHDVMPIVDAARPFFDDHSEPISIALWSPRVEMWDQNGNRIFPRHRQRYCDVIIGGRKRTFELPRQ